MSVTTSACPDTQPPTAPGNVTASTRTTTSIALTWAAATDNVGVAGYGVYNGANLVQTTAGTTGIVSGLTCSTNYTLSVDAFDAPATARPRPPSWSPPSPAPTPPHPRSRRTCRLASATTTSVTLAWNASTDNVGVTGYDVYRATTKVGTATTTSYTINGLTCGTAYSVGVRALDNAGNTSPQASTSITTTACATPPPPASTTCPLPAYPDAGCTGVPAGTVLTPSGGLTITTAGTVIDGRDITGQVVVNAPNVTIRNTRDPQQFDVGRSTTTAPDCWSRTARSSTGPYPGSRTATTRSATANFTVRRTEITGCENAANIRRPATSPSRTTTSTTSTPRARATCGGTTPHTDGIQVGGGGQSRDSPQLDRPGWFGDRWRRDLGDHHGLGRRHRTRTCGSRTTTSTAATHRTPSTRRASRHTNVYINRNRIQRAAYGYTACVRLGVTVTSSTTTVIRYGRVISPDNGAGGWCSN